jgi:hypothetical protein
MRQPFNVVTAYGREDEGLSGNESVFEVEGELPRLVLAKSVHESRGEFDGSSATFRLRSAVIGVFVPLPDLAEIEQPAIQVHI